MSINDKIKQILIDKNFTPSYFADEIGVQRSSISHILSGRNRPSFDIIQKIIRRFPELGYEWIMEDDSKTSANKQTSFSQNRTSLNRLTNERYSPTESTYSNATSSVRSQRNEIAPSIVNGAELASTLQLNNAELVATNNTEKRVEKILMFYNDGSFREYTPLV